MRNLYRSILVVLLFLGTNLCLGQLVIGKEMATNESVLLEFGQDNKGLILPSVIDAPNSVGGTMIFSLEQKSVLVKEEKNNGVATNWTNLSINEQEGKVHDFSNLGEDIIVDSTGVILGSDTSSKPGILVLESTEKVLVLPKVNQAHNDIVSPIAGTILYDTSSAMLAVFDGNNWSYWN